MAITINGTTGIDLGGTTRGTVDASWTTAGRPATPSAGQFGFNTTLGCYETYTGTAWNNASVWTTATRPTGVTGLTGFNTSLGSFEVYNGTSWIGFNTNTIVVPASYLVVAGGGGAGYDYSGGG
jgi:hypothetical protein